MIDRTFDAVVIAWDTLVATDPVPAAAALRRRIEALTGCGVEVAVVTGGCAGDLDACLHARPAGTGRLLLGCRHGAELYEVGPRGPVRLHRRRLSGREQAVLDRAVVAIRDRLDSRGVAVRSVPGRFGRRVLGLRWSVDAPVPTAGAATLVRRLVADAVATAGVPDLLVTTTAASHLDVSLAGDGDAMRDLTRRFAAHGIGPGLVLVVGDFAGDAGLLVPELDRATVVSVGRRRTGRPGVVHRSAGLRAALAVLDEQVRRRAERRVPTVDGDPAWTVPLHDGPDGRWTEHDVESARPRHGGLLDLRTSVWWAQERLAGPTVRTLSFASVTIPGLFASRVEGPAARVAAGAPLRPPPGAVGQPPGHADGWRWAPPDVGGLGTVAVQRQARCGGRRTVERLAVRVGAGHASGTGAAVATLYAATERGFDRLLAEHRRAWAGRWDTVDVRLPEDPALQRAVRSALHRLWTEVTGRPEVAVDTPGAPGHVGWEADLLVLPALVTMDPPTAAAMVDYRLRRLPAAREAARAAGARGALFPWASTPTGQDAAPGRRDQATTEHVTAAVAWAAVHAAGWSNDRSALAGRWQPLLVETARYWAHRFVAGPDTSTTPRSSALSDTAAPPLAAGPGAAGACGPGLALYTRMMARWNLRAAAAMADAAVPETERARWLAVAGRLSAARLSASRPAGGRAGPAAGGCVDQPDPRWLAHLLPDDAGARATMDPPVDHPGAAAAFRAVTAGLLARAGRPDAAVAVLRDVLLAGPAPTAAATCAAAWTALLAGFAGIRMHGGVLCIDPHLPASWRTAEVRFRCLGRRVRLVVQPDAIVLHSDAPLWVDIAGHALRRVGGTVRVPRNPSRHPA